MRGIDQLQQARDLYFSAAGGSATAAKEEFIRFVCVVALDKKDAAAAASAASARKEETVSHERKEPEHLDLLEFSLPQSVSPSLLQGWIEKAFTLTRDSAIRTAIPAVSCSSNNQSHSTTRDRGTGEDCQGYKKPSWLKVSDSMELIGGLLAHLAEATQRCGGMQPREGGQTAALNEETEAALKAERSALVKVLVQLLRLYQQRRVLGVLAEKGKPLIIEKEGAPVGGGASDEVPKTHPGDGEVWQLVRWSLNTTMLLKALANFAAGCEAAREAALAADGKARWESWAHLSFLFPWLLLLLLPLNRQNAKGGRCAAALPVLLTFRSIDETSPFSREAATLVSYYEVRV